MQAPPPVLAVTAIVDTTPLAAQLIRDHQVAVWRFLRLLGCTTHEADDLTQETFLIVLRRRFEHRADASTRAFLLRTARNLHRHAIRARRRQLPPLDDLEAAWHARWSDGGDDWVAALRHCLARLGDRPRRAIELFHGEDHSRADVARVLGLGVNGVKTMLQRARAWLRQCIDRELQG